MKTADGDYPDTEDCCVTPCEFFSAAIDSSYIFTYVPQHMANRVSVGQMWVANDEYASQVNFCPYCGKEAPLKIKAKKDAK
jgi:hypothetical protein